MLGTITIVERLQQRYKRQHISSTLNKCTKAESPEAGKFSGVLFRLKSENQVQTIIARKISDKQAKASVNKFAQNRNGCPKPQMLVTPEVAHSK